MNKMEAKLTHLLKDEPAEYPDFDAMWTRLESRLPETGTPLLPVPAVRKRPPLRKAAAIGALAALLAAAPVVAAVANRWDTILSNREGVRSALEQGLGQTIGQSLTRENVTITVETAVVDENRTGILFRLNTRDKTPEEGTFFNIEEVELKDAGGQPVEGWQQLNWDPAAKVWRGYFETEWVPPATSSNVMLTFSDVKAISPVEHELALRPLEEKEQTFDIRKDGIRQLTVKPFIQGDKMMLNSTVVFDQPEVQKWVYPRIGIYRGDAQVPEARPGVSGKPDEHGNYTAQQIFLQSELKQEGVSYKLLYEKEVKRVDADWAFNLKLDKHLMESGTVKRQLNIPLENKGVKMTLTEMIRTPTQIRIKASNERYSRFPFRAYSLEVDGVVLGGGSIDSYTNPEETVFRFEIPSGVQVKEESEIIFVAKHERVEHTDAKAPIPLREISEEKKSITTDVGGYSVLWTYYLKDGGLYVQSESADHGFGGVNQTYILRGETRDIGKKITYGFGGNGNNQATDVYPGFVGKEADVYIFWYYTEDPGKELRTVLTR